MPQLTAGQATPGASGVALAPSMTLDGLLSTFAADALACKNAGLQDLENHAWWDERVTPLDELTLMLRLHVERQDMPSVILLAGRIMLRKAVQQSGRPDLLAAIAKQTSVSAADLYGLHLIVRELADGKGRSSGTVKEGSERKVDKEQPRSKVREPEEERTKNGSGAQNGSGKRKEELTFAGWSEKWLVRKQLGVRRSTFISLKSTVNGHLVPYFGETAVHKIRERQIVEFRETLRSKDGQNSRLLSLKRINEIIRILGGMVVEAAEEQGFEKTAVPARLQRVTIHEIDPFSAREANELVEEVDQGWRNYLTVRLFAGLQTGEINGLKQEYIRFETDVMQIRETLQHGENDGINPEGSERDVAMVGVVRQAIWDQVRLTGKRSEYVFCNRDGGPIDSSNFTKRVWYPLLARLNLRSRRPHNMRHTAAVLWLAQGMDKEWVAKQLGYKDSGAIPKAYIELAELAKPKDARR